MQIPPTDPPGGRFQLLILPAFELVHVCIIRHHHLHELVDEPEAERPNRSTHLSKCWKYTTLGFLGRSGTTIKNNIAISHRTTEQLTSLNPLSLRSPLRVPSVGREELCCGVGEELDANAVLRKGGLELRNCSARHCETCCARVHGYSKAEMFTQKPVVGLSTFPWFRSPRSCFVISKISKYIFPQGFTSRKVRKYAECLTLTHLLPRQRYASLPLNPTFHRTVSKSNVVT